MFRYYGVRDIDREDSERESDLSDEESDLESQLTERLSDIFELEEEENIDLPFVPESYFQQPRVEYDSEREIDEPFEPIVFPFQFYRFPEDQLPIQMVQAGRHSWRQPLWMDNVQSARSSESDQEPFDESDIEDIEW
jgi:hypothetical protein